MRAILTTLAFGVLAGAWLGPLPHLARHSFAAHMTMHMAVVAVAAPLAAIAIAGSRIDPARAMPRVVAPLQASVLELVVVWAWHVPAWHQGARQETVLLVAEQTSFLAAGLILWVAAVGGDRRDRLARGAAGVAALLFTSIHMTLLGALFALANRPLFAHPAARRDAAALLTDQHLGGVIMLLVGGAAYLVGGLWLTAAMLGARDARPGKRLAS